MLNTLKSKQEISFLFSCGSRLQTPFVTFIFLPTDTSGRCAFIAGKKNGNAVWRNSAKRRMRELCRDLGGPWSAYNVIFLAKKALLTSSYSKVLKICENELCKNGLFGGEQNVQAP